MKWLNFFIERPITSGVINAMMVICGILALNALLIDEYPQVIVPRLKVWGAEYAMDIGLD